MTEADQMRLIIVSGLSGSGKSVALHVLEDLGYYCIDNMPAALLKSLLQEVTRTREQSGSLVAVGVDARNRKSDLEALPGVIAELRQNNIQTDLLFLQASDEILLKRYSETRRRHPLAADGLELRAAIARERELLGQIINAADLVIDTSRSSIYELADAIRSRVDRRKSNMLSVLIESFGYKHGIPADADFVFDLRCLPNPYWEPELRKLTGKDSAVQAFLDRELQVQQMYEDILAFLSRNEFPITETELKLIASAAIIGESSNPKAGYSTPAAIGIPSTLYPRAKNRFCLMFRITL